jgi:hypothetical protein
LPTLSRVVKDRLKRALQAAEKLMFCFIADFKPYRKRSPEEGFTGCRKAHVLYQGTALAGPYQTSAMRALAPEVFALLPGAGFSTDY